MVSGSCGKIKKNECPITLPCQDHEEGARGNWKHLSALIADIFGGEKDCVRMAIPCDSIEAWVVAAYDENPDAEMLEDPWQSIISKGKGYQGIRIPGHKKRLVIHRQFAESVCENWDVVKDICASAAWFEDALNA